jgi:hypothetical protein
VLLCLAFQTKSARRQNGPSRSQKSQRRWVARRSTLPPWLPEMFEDVLETVRADRMIFMAEGQISSNPISRSAKVNGHARLDTGMMRQELSPACWTKSSICGFPRN